jgi:hypothetical protein
MRCNLKDVIQRFGKSLRGQQMGLCEEWRKVNADESSVLAWEKEVRDFDGTGPLSGEAWGHLQAWRKKQPSSQAP